MSFSPILSPFGAIRSLNDLVIEVASFLNASSEEMGLSKRTGRPLKNYDFTKREMTPEELAKRMKRYEEEIKRMKELEEIKYLEEENKNII